MGGEGTFESEFTEYAIPIESVKIGQRIHSANPLRNDTVDASESYAEHKLIELEFRHTSGSMVDAQLLRSPEWIEVNGLVEGRAFDLQMTEIAVRGRGYVRSISDAPEIESSSGNVVSGRFRTRVSKDLVRVTFASGVVLIGTSNHPVWSPAIEQWLGLGELEMGGLVSSREGNVSLRQRHLLQGLHGLELLLLQRRLEAIQQKSYKYSWSMSFRLRLVFPLTHIGRTRPFSSILSR